MSLNIAENGDTILSDARTSMVVQAAAELEVLGTLLPKLEDDDSLHFSVRGIASRMILLSRVVINGFDEMVKTSDLEREVLLGPFSSNANDFHRAGNTSE